MLLITTSSGIVSTLRRELSYHRFKHFKPFDTGVYTNGELAEATYLNVWLRTATKVRLELGESRRSQTFESLYQRLLSHDWSQYLDEGRGITIDVHTRQSMLNAHRTIQSVAHKGIIHQLTGDDDGNWFVDPNLKPLEIRITIDTDHVRIWINTSGSSLHMRGYRTQAGEAPLREHIAAAMVLMTRRGYSAPLIDPLCGSGTIPIEAALLASNRAPGLHRSFARESFPATQPGTKKNLIDEATAKIYDKTYDISGYDTDESVIETARANAQRAGVDQIVKFETKNVFDQQFDDTQSIITNPPYGQRLNSNEVQKIHTTLARETLQTHASTIISGYAEAENLFRSESWKHVKMKNGGNEVVVFVKREV